MLSAYLPPLIKGQQRVSKYRVRTRMVCSSNGTSQPIGTSQIHDSRNFDIPPRFGSWFLSGSVRANSPTFRKSMLIAARGQELDGGNINALIARLTNEESLNLNLVIHQSV